MTSNSSRYQRCSTRKGVLKISQNSQETTCARVCNFIEKETLPQVLSCEFSEILKNRFITEHLQTTASGPTIMYGELSLGLYFLCLHFHLKEVQLNHKKLYLKQRVS